MKSKSLIWFALLIVAGVVTRWIPHPPNFTALLAIALYAGFVLPPALALIVPVAAAFLGDAWLGFHDEMWVVYLSLIPLVFAGRLLPVPGKPSAKWVNWILAGLTGAVFFYVTTNFAVWYFSGIYPRTAEGLTECFVLAIPFFHNSVLATWLFLGLFETVRAMVPAANPRFATAK